MKVFISWSEERSKKMAEFFFEWLPQVIQAIEPWISKDIAKGARSTPEISLELEKSKIGIICLTPENLDNKWILFEAGALSKINATKVCTFLLDLTPSDITPPLSQFQHTIFSKEDVYKLVQTINQQLSLSDEKPLPDKTLNQVFERSWAEFDKRIAEIIQIRPKKVKELRAERDILIEMLELLRRIDQSRISTINQKDDNIITDELLISLQGKLNRLVNDFGVHPPEAIRSIINELNKEIPLTRSERYAISNHLRNI
jgi:hypothetical protein